MEDEADADVAEFELLIELTGAGNDEDTEGWGGIGGTKYCGWNPVDPGGSPDCWMPEEECNVGVCGDTEMGGGSPPVELVGGGGVGRVAIEVEEWVVATDDGGGIDKEDVLENQKNLLNLEMIKIYQIYIKIITLKATLMVPWDPDRIVSYQTVVDVIA